MIKTISHFFITTLLLSFTCLFTGCSDDDEDTVSRAEYDKVVEEKKLAEDKLKDAERRAQKSGKLSGNYVAPNPGSDYYNQYY